MRVLLTGATGDIGSAVTRRLLAQRWSLRLIGLEAQAPFSAADFGEDADIDYAQCDISDSAALSEQLAGCNAVIHLAALRGPTLAPNEEVFRINVAGTFNVYEAAARAGIKRVVQASSVNAIGCAWSIDEIHPQYFPIDEEHPRVTTDAYSLSKQLVEDIADYYYRRDGISGTSLRFPWVYNREKHITPDYLARKQQTQDALTELLEQDETKQREWVDKLLAEVRDFRRTRPLEYAQVQNHNPFVTDETRDPLWSFIMFDRYNFWMVLDDRDAAQAIEKSLSANYEGHHALFINDAYNNRDVNSERLLKLFYPDVSARHRDIKGNKAVVSIARARDLLEFEPKFSMHSYIDE